LSRARSSGRADQPRAFAAVTHALRPQTLIAGLPKQPSGSVLHGSHASAERCHLPPQVVG
jgi:hypothetical protein